VLSLSCKKLFGLGDDEVCIYGDLVGRVAGYKEDPVWLWDVFCDDLFLFCCSYSSWILLDVD
jgi:hypothetical protein